MEIKTSTITKTISCEVTCSIPLDEYFKLVHTGAIENFSDGARREYEALFHNEGLHYDIVEYSPSARYPFGLTSIVERKSYLHPVRGHDVTVVEVLDTERVIDMLQEYVRRRAEFVNRGRKERNFWARLEDR